MELHRRSVTPEVSLFVDAASGEPRVVSSSFPRQTWKARQDATAGRPDHPGTALLIGQGWFEIVAERPDAKRASTTLYDLAPWDDSLTIRGTDELSAEACRAAARRHREEQKRRRRGNQLVPLAILTGLLPAEDQLRFEREYGVPTQRATLLSALPLLAGAVLALFVGFAAAYGHDFGSWTRFARELWDWKLLFLYLVVESYLRLSSGMSSHEPVGSLFVAGPITLARSVRDAVRGTPKGAPAALPHSFEAARDSVRPWPGPEADLEVRSRLPKNDWTVNTTTVVYQGTPYQLVDHQVLDEGTERFRFLLQLAGEDVLQQRVCVYEPEEVRELYRAQRRLEASTWVETFGLVWGWLDHDRQERLAATYDYDPDRMTRLSILFNSMVGAIAAAQGFVRMKGLGGMVNVLEFFAGLALLWECGLRWKYWRAGQWRPSWLGALVRSYADRLLRWEKTA